MGLSWKQSIRSCFSSLEEKLPLRFYGRVICCLVLFFVLKEFYVLFFYRLYPSLTGWQAFRTVSFFLGTLASPGFWVPALLPTFLMIFLLKETSWDRLDSRILYMFVVLLVVVLGWNQVMSPFNFFFNQGFYFERGLLLILAIMVCWHPGFLCLFLMTHFCFASQFSYLGANTRMPDQELAFYMLFFFLAWLVVGRILEVDSDEFLYGALVLTGANYFSESLAKIFNSPHGYEWALHYRMDLTQLWIQFMGWGQYIPFEKASVSPGRVCKK